MKRTRLWLALGTAGALALTACGNGNEGGESADAGDNGNGQAGDVDIAPELNVAFQAQPPTLDPVPSTVLANRLISRMIFEPLIAMDENLEPQPVLAESYEVSDDGLTYTFVLREGTTFHDGAELTEEDVLASLERWREVSNIGIDYFSEATFESPEDGVVTMTLPEPMYVADQLFADPAQMPYIMRAEVIEGVGSSNVEEYVGTGPYEFGEWQPDQHIRIDRYEDYVSPEGPPSALAGEKTAYFEEMYFHFVPDATTRVTGLQTGEFHAADGIPHDNFDAVDGDPNIDTVIGPSGVVIANFNKAEGIMSDVNMRRAAFAAIDTEAMLLASYGSEQFFDNTSSLMPEESPWHTAVDPEFDELRTTANPELAAEYLEEAGYDGEEIRILSTRDYDDFYTVSVMLQQQLEEAGMNTDLIVQDWTTVTEVRDDPGAQEITVGAVTNWPIVPATFLYLNPDWYGWTDSDDIRAASTAMVEAEDEESAFAAMEDLQTAFADYLPIINAGGRTVISAERSSEVSGLEYHSGIGEIFHHIKPVE